MAELEQTDDQMWLIVDSSEIAGNDSRTEQIEGLIADGHSVCADTLEELAEKINIDPEVLVATVNKYNEGMLNGKDEFGKATSADSVIETAPFYASLRTPTVHHTMGGVEINTDTEVLDADGNVILGLYAAGETTGGIHGNNRLGGNAYPDIMTFGRIAGKNAAKTAGTSAANTSTETANTETANIAEGAYRAGTYTASAQGYQGEVQIAVTIGDNGKIKSVQILDYSTETPDVGQAAALELTKAIVTTQSTEVDGVSGATLTSTAVLSAVQDALNQAK
jgi:fumarate reductase flavoprotein subunit